MKEIDCKNGCGRKTIMLGSKLCEHCWDVERAATLLKGDISEHFSRHEFACKCGCGFDTVDVELSALCEEVRELDGGLPMTPSCGCRCEKHNKDVGGEDNSQHLVGKAADLPCRNPWHVYRELCERYPDKCGFGVYSWGVHVDVRADKARWVRW